MKYRYGLVLIVCMAYVVSAFAGQDAATTEKPVSMSPTTTDELLAVDKLLSDKTDAARAHAEAAALNESDAETAVASMKEAAEAIDKLNGIYEKYLAAHPEDYKAVNYFGNFSADLLGKEEVALGLWKKALKMNPDYADPHNNVATHYLHAGEPGKAMDEFRTAIKLDGKKADYHFNLAQAYYLYRPVALEKYGWNLEQLYGHAMKESRLAVELKPDDYRLNQDYAISFFGAVQFGVKPDWQAARAAWARCLELAPDKDQKVHVLLWSARVELRDDRYKETREFAREVLAIDPGNKSAERLIEMSLEKDGQVI